MSRGKLQGYAGQGGAVTIPPGNTSTYSYLRTYISCTVTVTLSGGGALVIYSDNAGTVKANPFTSDADGYWYFFADDGHYDVTFSGGDVTVPYTLSNFVIVDSGGAVTLAGDVTGSSGANTVVKLRNRALAATAPTAGQAIVWNNGTTTWEPGTPAGAGVSSIIGTANQVVASSPTGAVTLSTPQSIGTASTPTFASLTLSGLTAKSFAYSGTAGLLATTAAPTNGQLLIGSTGAVPVAAALTAGAGISVTNGAGTITIAATGGANHDMLAATHTDSAASAVSRGGLIVGNSTPAWSLLPVGAAARVLRSNGVDASWAQVNAATDLTGLTPVANGGTGISAGTATGVPYFATTSTMASSPALTANRVVVGGATGPTVLGAGTTVQVLHGNAAGAPAWGGVNLATDLTIAVGTVGQTLRSTGAAVAWVPPSIEKPITLTFAAPLATDAATGSLFRCVLTDDFTLSNPTNAVDGQRITWELIQDGTGSRLITLDSNFVAGPFTVTLTTTLNKRDFLVVIYNSGSGKFYVVDFTKGY